VFVLAGGSRKDETDRRGNGPQSVAGLLCINNCKLRKCPNLARLINYKIVKGGEFPPRGRFIGACAFW